MALLGLCCRFRPPEGRRTVLCIEVCSAVQCQLTFQANPRVSSQTEFNMSRIFSGIWSLAVSKGPIGECCSGIIQQRTCNAIALLQRLSSTGGGIYRPRQLSQRCLTVTQLSRPKHTSQNWN